MKFVRVVRGQPKGEPQALPKAWGSVSGFDKLPARDLARHGWYPWEEVEAPAVDERTHKVVTVADVSGGVARPRHEVVPLTDAECRHELTKARRAALKRLAEIRWKHETGGIDFKGIPLHSDRESYTAIKLAALEGREERWKGADGHWYELSPDRLQEAAAAVSRHRRDCFAREEELSDKLRAADNVEALDSIDLEAGWPSS